MHEQFSSKRSLQGAVYKLHLCDKWRNVYKKTWEIFNSRIFKGTFSSLDTEKLYKQALFFVQCSRIRSERQPFSWQFNVTLILSGLTDERGRQKSSMMQLVLKSYFEIPVQNVAHVGTVIIFLK